MWQDCVLHALPGRRVLLWRLGQGPQDEPTDADVEAEPPGEGTVGGDLPHWQPPVEKVPPIQAVPVNMVSPVSLV